MKVRTTKVGAGGDDFDACCVPRGASANEIETLLRRAGYYRARFLLTPSGALEIYNKEIAKLKFSRRPPAARKQ
jgi:hypothetical protein